VTTAADLDEVRAAVERSDEKKARLALIPEAAELFPEMVASRRSWYMDVLSIAAVDGFMGEQIVFWWNEQLGLRTRRLMCRLARVNPDVACEPWNLIPPADKARVIARFMWLRDWVNSIHPPLSPCLPQVLNDE